MIEWQESYKLGVDVVDEQHKRLFEIAADAEEMLRLPKNMDKFDHIITIIESLKDYMKFHFLEEQKILESIRYPKYFAHLVEHQDFVEQMEKIDMSVIDYNQQGELVKIVDFIIEWLTDHVLHTDIEWATYYKKLEMK